MASRAQEVATGVNAVLLGGSWPANFTFAVSHRPVVVRKDMEAGHVYVFCVPQPQTISAGSRGKDRFEFRTKVAVICSLRVVSGSSESSQRDVILEHVDDMIDLIRETPISAMGETFAPRSVVADALETDEDDEWDRIRVDIEVAHEVLL